MENIVSADSLAWKVRDEYQGQTEPGYDSSLLLCTRLAQLQVGSSYAPGVLKYLLWLGYTGKHGQVPGSQRSTELLTSSCLALGGSLPWH